MAAPVAANAPQQQTGDEEVARLGLVAVEPHEAADQRTDRDRREESGQREGSGRPGQCDDHGHDDPSEEHQCRHHNGEGDTVAAASLHGSDPNGAGAAAGPPPHPFGRPVSGA